MNNKTAKRSTTEQKTSEDKTQDSSKVCRTCATVSEFVIPIFEGEGLKNNLAEKIHKHLPIRVSAEDNLPLEVCIQCISKLMAWYQLEQRCVQAEAELRTRRALAAAGRDDSAGKSKPSSSSKRPKLKEIAKIEVQADPPPNEEPTPRTKPCVYCPMEYPEHLYAEHILEFHSDFIFHCEECHMYVDRKEFIRHMTIHAREYARTRLPVGG